MSGVSYQNLPQQDLDNLLGFSVYSLSDRLNPILKFELFPYQIQNWFCTIQLTERKSRSFADPLGSQKISHSHTVARTMFP